MDLAARAAGVGALADPTRRALYEYVASRPEPVGREEAARALALPHHTASFHLDKLVEVGLLTADYRRLTGRSGPGAGRPSKVYRRADRQWTVSLPDRHYDLVGRILAEGVERARSSGTPIEEAIEEVAASVGREVGEAHASGTPADLPQLADSLTGQGFEPRVDDDTVVLANCPFDVLAKSHTALVCGLNHRFVQGVVDGVDCRGAIAHLEPEPGQCCVKVRRRPDA